MSILEFLENIYRIWVPPQQRRTQPEPVLNLANEVGISTSFIPYYGITGIQRIPTPSGITGIQGTPTPSGITGIQGFTGITGVTGIYGTPTPEPTKTETVQPSLRSRYDLLINGEGKKPVKIKKKSRYDLIKKLWTDTQ
jgi:hypothetical protein